jgi:glucans biosynthesis protein
MQVLVLGVFACFARWVDAAPRFEFDEVARRAQQAAAKPYAAPKDTLPAELKKLSYDQHRDIRFSPERALWRNEKLPFELQFFHLGFLQTQPVQIHEITPQGVKHVAFDAKHFDYGKNKLNAASWGDLGFAGFRIHYPLNTSAYKDELAVFLGASYFRVLGKGQLYGLSARGLAIDTVGGKGEEFPRFTEFWVERPTAKSTTLTVYALMDSPRATGAYRFEIKPGDDTVVDVRSRVFARQGAAPVTTLGIAPLTSMFHHGENQPRTDEFRPEVHDSDGLMMVSADGEWLWRPLLNPKQPLATSFAMQGVKGFGLMQRDRSFASYEDVEARYERRPSTWIEPIGNWGAGRVELLLLPAPDETHDNVVAYWVPEKAPTPGQPLDLSYRMRWQGTAQQRPPNGWTVQSRVGAGYGGLKPGEQQYVVDFAGPALDALPAGAQVKPVVSVGPGAKLVETNAYRNDANGHWRMTLRVQRTGPAANAQQPVELRAFLQHQTHALTETWTSLLLPLEAAH